MSQAPTIAPASVTANSPAVLIELVRQARAMKTPLVDYGIAHQGLGHAPPANHAVLTVEAPAAGPVLEHYVRDLTVRAAAGARISDLQTALKANNQFLPLDVDGDLTLGEVINHNVYGALRPAFGSIRDLLLGLRYIDGNAEDIGVGGRTVKNVAGYDVSRFLVGSLGTLALIHEATVRTYAIPEHVLAVELQTADPTAIDPLLSDWLLTDAAPQGMLLERVENSWRLGVSYFGRRSACIAQLRSLEMFVPRVAPLMINGSNERTLEVELADLESRRAWRRTAKALVKLVVPPAVTGAACVALSKADVGQPLRIDALPVHGCIFAGADLTAGETLSLDALVTKLATSLGGFRVWHARPHETFAAVAPFAPAQPEWPLLKRIKNSLDPYEVFNPGRLLR